MLVHPQIDPVAISVGPLSVHLVWIDVFDRFCAVYLIRALSNQTQSTFCFYL
jgi:hypothetical protein